MLHSAITAQKLAHNVCSDTGLPKNVRQEAENLLWSTGQHPDRVIERLDVLRVEITPQLITKSATISYARCVSIETFYNHHLAYEIYDVFRTPSDYRNFISSLSDPDVQLLDDLREGILIPAKYSWLVPYDYIKRSTATQIKTRLNFKQAPPYVVMVFTVDSLLKAGVKIREPRGTDTIPRRHTEWSPNNVKGERIDSNIPRTALKNIKWRNIE